jgi:hypothetical protein
MQRNNVPLTRAHLYIMHNHKYNKYLLNKIRVSHEKYCFKTNYVTNIVFGCYFRICNTRIAKKITKSSVTTSAGLPCSAAHSYLHQQQKMVAEVPRQVIV